MKSHSIAAALALAVFTVGCKDAPPTEADAASSFCRSYFGAIAERQAACEAWSSRYRSLEASWLETFCADAGAAVAARPGKLDAANASACLSALRAALAATACSERAPAEPTACDAVFQPTVQLRGTCSDDADCIDGWCDVPAYACPGAVGTCAALGGEGDACESIRMWPSRGTCAAGLTCQWKGDGERCVAPLAPVGEGETCGPLAPPCADGLYCHFFPYPDTRSPVCTPTVGLGIGCLFSAMCPAGLVCGAHGVCAAWVREGASCAADATECGAGLFCDGGTCRALPDLGASCAAAPACLQGYCSANDARCHAPKPSGPCVYDEECTGRCSGGQCTPPACP